MKGRKIVGILICTLLIVSELGSIIAIADEIDQESPEGASFTVQTHPQIWHAQAFKPQSSTLTKVELFMDKTSGNPGEFILSIRHNTPDSADLTSITKQSSQIGDPPTHWEEFDFPDVSVTPGDTYFIIFTAPNSGYSTDIYTIRGPGSGFHYPNGNYWIMQEGVSPWEEWDNDLSFRTYKPSSNYPPNKPNPPSGPTYGDTGVEYTYTASTTDSDGDQIYYQFDWGSGQGASGWLGPYNSGSTASASKIWNEESIYDVRVRAKDTNDAITDWSDPLPVTIVEAEDPCDPPSVTTGSASYISCINGLFYGNLDDLGGANSCDVWFVYDTTSHVNWYDYERETTHETKYNSGSFESSFLPMGGTMYYRAVASNNGGTSPGAEKSFKCPCFDLDPQCLDFGEVAIRKTATKTFEIWNDGDFGLNYEFSWGSWISEVTPTSGSSTGEHDTISVTIDTSGLSIGEKEHYIEIDNGCPIPGYFKYPVKVKVVHSIAPPDATLTTSDIDFHLYGETPPIGAINLYLDKWSSIPSKMDSASYGHYGYEANTNNGYQRAAIKAEYDNLIPEVPLIPETVGVETLLRATYTVPVTTAPNTLHFAKISLSAECNGHIRIFDLGSSNALVTICIREGIEETYPYSQFSVAHEVLNKYEVGAFIQGGKKTISKTYFPSNNYVGALLAEGKTYSIWISTSVNLLLEGMNIDVPFVGKVGYYGKGWADIKLNIDSINIDYENPPPSPPESEHPPEITGFTGSKNLVAGLEGTYTVSATDRNGDSLVFKYYWGDGSESDWTGTTKKHSYDTPGKYYVSVQAKEETIYELKSNITEPIEITVLRPKGHLIIESPSSGDTLIGGTSKTIKWKIHGTNVGGGAGDLVHLVLYKENDPDFHREITSEPISVHEYKFEWNVPNDITSDNDYRIIFWNNPACGISDKFTIKINRAPNQPNKPSGPTNIKRNKQYCYSGLTTDPDGDQLYYQWSWGDGTTSEWLGPYNSGDTIEACHTWKNVQEAQVRLRAKDIHGVQGDWSDSTISRFKSRENILLRFLNYFPLLEKLLQLPIFKQIFNIFQ